MFNPFATPCMALGYARASPPLHAAIVDRALALAGAGTGFQVAVDLRCGAGLSTLPRLGLADQVIVADLITAAGSLNCTDTSAVFREAARVLAPGGLCVYDFSQGRTFLVGRSRRQVRGVHPPLSTSGLRSDCAE